MSISLLVEQTNGQSRSLPVATELAFSRLWLPLCQQLRLEWLPLFQSGLPITEKDRPYVLAELRRFEAAGADTEAAERARAVRKTLSTLIFETGLRVYVG